MSDLPDLTQFQVECGAERVAHLVFDAPGRSMNVFSEAAIEDLGRFADWLSTSAVAGVVIRSGKPAFCAGADLAELGVAYDMIMAAPKQARTQVAFDHFFRLSQALRRLETAGKPVAAAIGGLALGGGCELALACHHRVMADSPQTFLGLPESLVGLLPGAGGTQRLPRLIGVEAALPVLLDGARLSAAEASAKGLVQAVTRPGEEVTAAEEWVRSTKHAAQPWDQSDWTPVAPDAVSASIETRRASVIAETRGHYPAPLAILECIERGFPQPMDAALRTEMEIFSGLIQRPEPRNMIQTLFLGKQDHARMAKSGELPAELAELTEEIGGALAGVVRRAGESGMSVEDIAAALEDAGFAGSADQWAGAPPRPHRPVPSASGLESAGLWFEKKVDGRRRRLGQALLRAAAQAGLPHLDHLSAVDQRVIDYAAVTELGFPAYLGGPLALARYLGSRAFELA
jgi:3-hydroxyacyl-CoA dehydrogenase/enoyl-CoA hydratase/3-hydroxybutyryl-CoA epimerase